MDINYFRTLHACAKHIEDDAQTIQILIERNEAREFVTDIERKMFARDLAVTVQKVHSESEVLFKDWFLWDGSTEPEKLDP